MSVIDNALTRIGAASTKGLYDPRSPGCYMPRAIARDARSHALDDRGDALAAADAHRNQSVTLTGPMQLVHALHREDASGSPDRMAERDRAAVRVHLGRIEAELLVNPERLSRERLVRFDNVHVGDLEPGLRQRILDRAHGPEPHDLRIDAGVSVRHEPRHRLEAALLGRGLLHQDHRRGCVVDA